MKPIKTIRSHVGVSRYMADLEQVAYIPRAALAVPSPYSYSPTWVVYQEPLGRGFRMVVIAETAHKVYSVFDVTGFPTCNEWNEEEGK